MTIPVLIVVDRRRFRMRLYEPVKSRLRVHSFKVAIGARGFATKAGEYTVRSKSTHPDWRAPDWAHGYDELGHPIAGRTFPFDSPINPFAGGFISFEDNDPDNDNEGQGFHGTKFDPMLGTRASHGCIRMGVRDFKRIYDHVPVGTLVVIH